MSETIPQLPPRDENSVSAGKRSLDVSVESFKTLTPELLAELKARHGLEISIRSSKPGVDALLAKLGDDALGGEPASSTNYDKVYDRTSPGYDRNYDRG